MPVPPSLRLWGVTLSAIALLVLATGCPGSGGGGGPQGGGQGTKGGSTPVSTELAKDSYSNWTTANTPKDWWTKREDTPWADSDLMVGEDVKLEEEKTITVGATQIVLPAGTSMWWRRLKPGYDVLPDKLYQESRDEHYKRLHPDGAPHKYSGPGPFGANQMIIGSIGKSSNLNPILLQDTASSDIVTFVFNRLISIDEKWNPIPQLAEGFTVAPDGSSYTYFIRPGVTFSDGTEVTAQDVEFTYSSILDDNVPSPRKGDFKDLDRIEVLDDYTITFHMKTPFAPWLRSNVGYGIIPRTQFDLDENRDWNAADFNRYPIGGGPYKLDKYEGEDVHLVRNEAYFGKPAPIERIIFKKTPSSELEQKQLQAAEIDLGAIMIQDLDKVGTEHPEIRQFRTAVGLGYSYMGFNHKSTFFKDLQVRQAIAHAVNRDNLISQVIKGHGELCNANIPPMSPYYDPTVKGYEYNVEKAKQLLEAAGWKDSDGDGIREKDGRPFRFDLITNEGNPYRNQTAVLIQSDLKLVGIDARPRLIEWSSFTQNFIRKHNFEAFILGWSLGVDPDDFSIFHSSQFDDGLNYGFYSNATVDELLLKGQVTVDEDERKGIYSQIQHELARDLPYLFLFYNKKSGGAQKRLEALPQVEPNDSSYVVPPMDASTWQVKGYGPAIGGPASSPE